MDEGIPLAVCEILWEFNFYLIDGKLFEEIRAEINKTKCNSIPNVMVPFYNSPASNWIQSQRNEDAAQCAVLIGFSGSSGGGGWLAGGDDEQQPEPEPQTNPWIKIQVCGDLRG